MAVASGGVGGFRRESEYRKVNLVGWAGLIFNCFFLINKISKINKKKK